MDCCNRCGGADDLRPLHRFADNSESSASTKAELVCKGCCTRVELNLGHRLSEHSPEQIMAFVLALSDAVDRLHDAYAARKRAAHG